jgi:hypothetical protein
MIKYEYTEINRLVSPHKYMYTSYKGSEFLRAYVNDRLSFLNKIKEQEQDNYPNAYDQLYAKSCILLVRHSKKNIPKEELAEVFNFDYSYGFEDQLFDKSNLNVVSLLSFNKSNPINSENLLVSVLDSQVNGGNQLLIEFWLDLLVKKFEVTKKIYEQYSVNFGKGLGQSDIIKIYWILFVSLSLHFSTTKNIKYLNTILKVSDLICSLNVSKVCKHLPSTYLALFLSFELTNIRVLSDKINEVCFDFT